VQAGKYQTRSFNDELVQAAARLILDRWRPEPFPQWVTCVPSNRQPTLVSDFAERLAATLNLPFVAAVRKTRDTEPQKMMENSTQQVRNLLGAFSVERDILKAPVLLTDDVIDSGWTLSVVGILLRIGGSGPVFPFALARATAGDS
jgi:ATP-dependent DNA helicase RecQ